MNCSLLPVIGFPHLQELLSLFFNVYPNLCKPCPLIVAMFLANMYRSVQIMKNISAPDCFCNSCITTLCNSYVDDKTDIHHKSPLVNTKIIYLGIQTAMSLPCTDLYVGPNHGTSFPFQKTMSTVWKHKISDASEKSLTLHSWYGVRSRWWVGPMSVRRPNNKSHLYEFSRTVPNGIPWSRNNLQGCLWPQG